MHVFGFPDLFVVRKFVRSPQENLQISAVLFISRTKKSGSFFYGDHFSVFRFWEIMFHEKRFLGLFVIWKMSASGNSASGIKISRKKNLEKNFGKCSFRDFIFWMNAFQEFIFQEFSFREIVFLWSGFRK